MPQIIVTVIDAFHFQVTILDSIITTHQVSIEPHYALKLNFGNITTAKLVEKSFEFLLQRESNTSIMRSFDLSVIARYFPEYEQVIAQ